jgi:hypothetical protein
VFERVRKQAGAGRVVTAYTVTCRSCGEVGEMQQNSIRTLPPDAVDKYFRIRGWSVGNRPNGDTCPACKRKPRTPKLEIVEVTTENPPMNVPATIPVKAEPPRAMTREDRRIVYAKVEDTYDVKLNAYSGDWSDHKVAVDLGVPRAWVRDIREEFFGPEIDAATAKRRADIAEAKVMHENIVLELRVLQKKVQEAAAKLEKLERE